MVKYPDNGDDLTDYTRHLVTVLPKRAHGRVTDALPVSDDTGDGSHFSDHDLQCDVLIRCHDNHEHPSLAETSRDVRALVWFPKMQAYIDYTTGTHVPTALPSALLHSLLALQYKHNTVLK